MLGGEHLLFPGVSLGLGSHFPPWVWWWLVLLSLLLPGWLFQLLLLWETLPRTLCVSLGSLILSLWP